MSTEKQEVLDAKTACKRMLNLGRKANDIVEALNTEFEGSYYCARGSIYKAAETDGAPAIFICAV